MNPGRTCPQVDARGAAPRDDALRPGVLPVERVGGVRSRFRKDRRRDEPGERRGRGCSASACRRLRSKGGLTVRSCSTSGLLDIRPARHPKGDRDDGGAVSGRMGCAVKIPRSGFENGRRAVRSAPDLPSPFVETGS